MPRRPARAWHPGSLSRKTQPEMAEWLAFAVLRDARTRTRLRVLHENYELFAASEGYPAVGELTFARHLERLGFRRRGTTFFGLRVYTAIPALRLLTRLELYGYRFATRDGELAWRGPAGVSDLERRVIARHRRELVAALRHIEEARARLRGESAPLRPWPAPPPSRRAA